VGGTDALTLLGLEPVRAWLVTSPAGEDGAATVSVPRRDRAWIGHAAADRDYARAVWLLTPPTQRGVLPGVRVTPATVTLHA
jgi:hypothetical protein